MRKRRLWGRWLRGQWLRPVAGLIFTSKGTGGDSIGLALFNPTIRVEQWITEAQFACPSRAILALETFAPMSYVKHFHKQQLPFPHDLYEGYNE